MRILKLPSYCFPEQISSSHISGDLESMFCDNDIHEIVFAPSPCRGLTPEQRKKYKKIKYEERANGAVQIYRFSMFKEPKNSVLRALRYTLIQIIQYFKAIHVTDIDVLAAGSTPPTQALLFSLLKKKLSKKYGRRVPFIYSLQDVFPDSLVLAGLTKKESIIWNIGRKIEAYSYKNADTIIVISEDIKRNIIDKGVPESKIVLIPNWVDTAIVHPVERSENTLSRELMVCDDQFYVVYAGNLGRAQAVDTVLEAAKTTSGYTDIKYLIFGQGVCENAIREKIEGEAIHNLRLFPLQPQSRISEVYSLGDVCVVTCKKGTGSGAFPSKTASILATATPIIAAFDADSELSTLISKVDCGYCVEPEDPKALAAKIIEAYNNRSALREKGNNGRVYTERNMSKDVCAHKYIDVYKSHIHD